MNAAIGTPAAGKNTGAEAPPMANDNVAKPPYEAATNINKNGTRNDRRAR
jgi:hypothetical protein